MNINKQYQPNLSIIGDIAPCPDDSLWINCSQDEVLKKVKPEGSSLKTISTFNIDVYSMAITKSNDLLVNVKVGSRLKIINSSTGKLTDSVYDSSPFIPSAIHVTHNNKVIIGGFNDKLDTNAVIVMSEMGDQEAVYEHDQLNQPLFRNLRSITSTSNGNIHVADYKIRDGKGRIVVLGQDGDVINTYTGHKVIMKEKPFKPVYIVTTPRDNVMAVGLNNHMLHILNNLGVFLTCYNTRDIEIIYPQSFVFTPT